MYRRAFELLLLIYPARFRQRWKVDLLAFLEEEWMNARARRGPAWRIRFWGHVLFDAIEASIRVRRQARPGFEARRYAMRGLVGELSAALRGFSRAPGFHWLAAFTLALGVAATTAVFAVLDGVVLRPLPYPESERLVRVATTFRDDPEDLGPMSHPDLLALGEQSRSLDVLAALETRDRIFQDGEAPEVVAAVAAGPGLLDLLGARAAAGRLFVETDHARGSVDVAILSHDAWRARYGSASDIVGRTIRLDGRPRVVIGVLDRDFVPPVAARASGAVVWTNLVLDPEAHGIYGAFALGRLRRGLTPQQATIELNGLVQEMKRPLFITGARAVDLLRVTVGPVAGTLWLLLAGVGLLLAISCANVANLMLARGVDARAEVVLRMVLGASSGRIVARQLLQGLLLGLTGGALGAGLAWASLAVFRAHGPADVPRLAEVVLDARVLLFTLAVSTVTSIAFAMLPALQASRRVPADVLRDGGRSTTSRAGVRRTLVVAETAMAFVLVVVSGLLLHGFLRLSAVDLGYPVDDLAALQVSVPRTDPPPAPGDRESRRLEHETTSAYFDRLLEHVRAVPGVHAAARSTFEPFAGFSMVQWYTVEGSVVAADGRSFFPSIIVSDGWMETMGARVIAGRDFDERDRAGGEPVVLVSEALARAHWPGATDVVGRRIKSGAPEIEDEPWYSVVGVVSDIRNAPGEAPVMGIYHPYAQEPFFGRSVLARASGELAPILQGLRRAVSDVDANVGIRRLEAVSDLAARSLAPPRFYTLLVIGFGAVALGLALIGIYGTTAYVTSRRTREIGVRLALGGEPRTVTRVLVRDAVGMALLGVALGVTIAAVGARFLQSYLFEVAPNDLLTFAVTACAVFATAVLAAWVPARRAARTDPLVTLRCGE